MGKFVIRKTNTGVKFDLKATNGQVIATSEVYTTDAACKKGIASLRINSDAPIEDKTDSFSENTSEKMPCPKIEILANGGVYNFYVKAKNGSINANSDFTLPSATGFISSGFTLFFIKTYRIQQKSI